MNEFDELLEEGIAAAKAEKRQKARALLHAVLEARPNDLAAWKSLISVVETHQEKTSCARMIRRLEAENNDTALMGDSGAKDLDSDRDKDPPLQDRAHHRITPLKQDGLRRRRRKRRRTKRLNQKSRYIRRALLATAIGAIATLVLVLINAVQFSGTQKKAHEFDSEDGIEDADYLTGRLGLVPMQIEIAPANLGWHAVSITLAVENQSNAFEKLSYSTKDATLFTEEGYTYPARLSYVNEGKSGIVSLNQLPLWLPPGFRFYGTYSHNAFSTSHAYYKVKARIAQNTHPSLLAIAGYGDLDLRQVHERNLDFPVVKDIARVERIGHSLTLPREQAKLTISGIEKKNLQFDRKGKKSDLYIVTVLQENLDAGYETKVPFYTMGINGEGIIGSLALATQNTLEECSPFPALGPSQSATVRACTVLPAGSKDVKIILAIQTNIAYEFVVLDSGY